MKLVSETTAKGEATPYLLFFAGMICEQKRASECNSVTLGILILNADS